MPGRNWKKSGQIQTADSHGIPRRGGSCRGLPHIEAAMAGTGVCDQKITTCILPVMSLRSQLLKRVSLSSIKTCVHYF